MVSEQERTGRYVYLPEEGRYGMISASLHDSTGGALALHEAEAAKMMQRAAKTENYGAEEKYVDEYQDYTVPMADADGMGGAANNKTNKSYQRRRSSRRDSLDSFGSTGSGSIFDSITRSETEVQSTNNSSSINGNTHGQRQSLVGRSIDVTGGSEGNASNRMLSNMNRRGSQVSSVHSGSATHNLAPAAQNTCRRRGSMMSSVTSLGNGNANASSRRGSVLSGASASRRGSMASAASSSSSYHRGRNNKAVDANLARSIKTDAAKVTVDDELWRQFKSRCSTTGSITNVAAKELLREQVMQTKCYHTEKQELVEAEMEQEQQDQQRWSRRASAVLSRQEQAVRDQANQVSTGLRRAFSSALSLVSMEALALQDEAVDVTEQQAILNSLNNSSVSTLHASSSISRFGESGITGQVLELDVKDMDAAGTERTAAQVLADSLGSSFGSMKRTFSNEMLAALGENIEKELREDAFEESTATNQNARGEETDKAARSTRSLSNRPKRGKRAPMLSSVGSAGVHNSRRSSVESLASSSSATGNSGASTAGSGISGGIRRSSYVAPTDTRRKSGRMSTLLLNFDDMEEELSDYRSDSASDEDEQFFTQEDIAAGPKTTGEESTSDLEASAHVSLQASQYLAAKLQSGDVQEAIGRHQALFRRLSEQHAMMASAAALQRRRSSRRLSLTSSEEGDGSVNLDDVQQKGGDDEDDSENELGKSFSTIKSYRSRAA